MKKEYKYTTDGKKVLVIGKLNSQETIVQEIGFDIKTGEEIRVGENFTTKSLLDSPVETWKEKKLRELEERYEQEYKEWNERLDKLYDERKIIEDQARLRADSLLKFIKFGDESQLETLKMFMAGECRYFFEPGFRPKILDENKFYYYENEWGKKRVEGLRLVSLMGKSDGRLDYKLHRWCDGSGDNGTLIYPFKTYDEALTMAQEKFDEVCKQYLAGEPEGRKVHDWFTRDSYKMIDGLQVSDEVTNKIRDEKADAAQKRIDKLQEEIQNIKNENTIPV